MQTTMASDAQGTVPGVGSLLQGLDKAQVQKKADNYVDFFDKSKGLRCNGALESP